MIKIFLSQCILFYQFLLYQLCCCVDFPFFLHPDPRGNVNSPPRSAAGTRRFATQQTGGCLPGHGVPFGGLLAGSAPSPVPPPRPSPLQTLYPGLTASAPQPRPPLRGLPGEEDAWEGNRQGQTRGGEVAWGEKRGSRLGWGLPPFPTLPRHLPRQRSAAMAGPPAAAAPGTGAAPPFQHPRRGTAPSPAPPTARVGPGGGVGEESGRSRVCLCRDRSGPIVYGKALVKCVLKK